jgi:hypothetical protein
MKKVFSAGLIALVATRVIANPIQTPFILPTAKVLPVGVRNLSYKGAIVNASRKFDETGQNVVLADPFFQPLSFQKILEGEADPAQRGLIEDTMNALGASLDESFGNTTGQVNAKVNAHVPVFAWGITKRITVAAVIPVIKSSVNIDTGVIQQNAALHQKMIADIQSKGASSKVVEFIDKMNQPVTEKLAEYNYSPLRNENKTELGDIRLISKFQAMSNELNRLTFTGALTVPTGKDQDVNKAVDIISGDGQTDIAVGADYDYLLNEKFTLTLGTLYTIQLPDQNAERIPTRVDSKLSIDIDPNTERNLGDIWMAAAAASYAYKGIQAAIGYNFQVRQRDQYSGNQFSQGRYYWLGEDTKQKMHAGLASLGYNTIHLFKQKKFPVPLAIALTHTRILGGENVVNDSLYALDMSLFF